MNKIVAAFLLVSLLLPVIATVKPVDAARTLTVPGSYSTIQQAIDAAGDGDTILVRKGTYNEQLVIDKQLFLRGEDKAGTVIATANSGAIILVSHDNVEVTGFTVRHDGSGRGYPNWYWSSGKAAIHLLNVKGCSIHDNLIVSRGCGIWLYGSNQNSIVENTIQECDYGIVVQSSSQNTLTQNAVTNSSNGLSLMFSQNNQLKDNNLHGNWYNFAISSSDLSGYINNLDSSNLIEGKPIIYWIDQTDQKVPYDAGSVVLVNCKGITVEGLTLKPSSQTAITLAGTQECVVKNNQISNSSVGIQLFNAQYDGIFNNTINVISEGIQSNGNGTIIQNNHIAGGTGISVGGYYQTIIGNTINSEQTSYFGDYAITCSGAYTNISYNTMQAAMRGISITGSNNVFYSNTLDNCDQILLNKANHNVIAKNTLSRTSINVREGSENVFCANKITNGSYGITISRGHNNTIYANTVENSRVGVELGGKAEYVTNNLFYQNSFIDNERQIGRSWTKNTRSFWDNGKEGNYWSDYSGSDWNFDGIGDSAYDLKSYYVDLTQEIEYVCGTDHHPLIRPFDISKAVIELPQLIDPAKPATAIQPHGSNGEPASDAQPDQSQLLLTAIIAATVVIAALATLALTSKKRKSQ